MPLFSRAPRLPLLVVGGLLAAATLPPSPATAEPPADPFIAASRQAAAQGHPVEVTSRTDAQTLTLANPDGTFTTTIDRTPQRALDNGAWKPVDTTLHARNDGTITPQRTTLPMAFTSGDSTTLATITTPDGSLAITMPFTLPTPRIDGDTLTYPDVLDDVDLSVKAGPESFSETLVVKTPQAAKNPAIRSLALTVNTSGLTYQLNPDGTSQAINQHGDPVLTSPAPVMWDASPGHDKHTPTAHQPADATQRLTTTATPASSGLRTRSLTPQSIGNATTVRLTPPTTALDNPAAKYPLYIDPGFSVAKSSFTVVRSGLSSYANNTDYLRVGYCAWDGCTPYYRARSYLSFPLTALAPRSGYKADIRAASLTLTQIHNAASASTSVELHKAGTFTASATWPGPLGDLIETQTKAGTDPIYFGSSTLASYIEAATNSATASLNVALKAPNENDNTQWKKFDNNAKLSITYAYPPAVPVLSNPDNVLACGNTTYVRTNRPTLHAKAAELNQDGGDIAIFHEILNTKSAVVASGRSVAGNNVMQSYPLTTALPDGTYTHRARSGQTRDGITLYSAYGNTKTFLIDTTAPKQPRVTSFTHPANQPGIGAIYGNTASSNSFMLTVDNDPRIAGYAYAWNTATVPATSTTTCQTNSSIGPNSGYVKATNGTAGLNLPPSIPATGSKLTVKAVDDAGNASPATTYDFTIAPNGTLISLTEAEQAPITAHTADYVTEPSNLRSAGAALTASPTTAGQSITLQITIPSDGQWIIQPALARSTNYAIISFAIDGVPIDAPSPITDDWTEATPTPLTVDLYSPTWAPLSYPLPSQHLTAGTHTLTLTAIGKNPATTTWYNRYLNPPRQDNAMSFSIDYIRSLRLP